MKNASNTKNENAEKSLSEINSSVNVPNVYESTFWRKFLAYSGPGALIAVGYMDPGNWLTSIMGGISYRYLLLSVILLSILVAMLMQYLAAKLGVVTQLDLAQIIAKHVSRPISIALWILSELAMMATDITSVVGSAIALTLLFKIPLFISILITSLDVFLLLALLRFGIQRVEVIVFILIFAVGMIFAYQVALGQPHLGDLLRGYIPQASLLKHSQLILSLGIIGATIMPHNLFLHSSLSQTRKFDHNDPLQVTEAIRFSKWDSNVHLIVALIINSLLLILGATLFYGKNAHLEAFSDLYNALKNHQIIGSMASPFLSTLFAVALLASGQNATITGTLSGQIVMEGFTNLKMPLWVRRVITRLLAIIPVIILVILFGTQEGVLDSLIVYSQIFLSLALPFSMFPLVYFTSQTKYMTEKFVNKKWVTWCGYFVSVVLTILNIQLIISVF
jgi:manganese transport protein